MPCSYAIFSQGRLVLTTVRDVLTHAEVKAFHQALREDPDFDPSFNQLIDARAATYLALSAGQAEEIAGRNPFAAGSRRAVVTERPAPFGLSRLTEGLRSAYAAESIQVFRDRGEALEWLGVAV